MTDPRLESYWDAVRTERYQDHLRTLPIRLEHTARAGEPNRAFSGSQPTSTRKLRIASAIVACVLVVVAGFIPVQNTETTGFLIAGHTESRVTSETLSAFEGLSLPVHHNLSVSADSQGTSFALFLPAGGSMRIDSWTERIENAISPSDLRVRTMDIVTDRTLWVHLLDRAGLTISASGTTRDEIQSQVEQQLDAFGTGRADVQQVIGPDGKKSIQIIISDIE